MCLSHLLFTLFFETESLTEPAAHEFGQTRRLAIPGHPLGSTSIDHCASFYFGTKHIKANFILRVSDRQP